MSQATVAATLTPQAEKRLVQFARACRAAASGVSLYPPGHPAIHGSLTRLVAAAQAASATGALVLTVMPDNLLVGEVGTAVPDRATRELAALFHSHGVGTIALHGGTDADSWRALLLLLARQPAETRAEGGIRHLWTRAGAASIEIMELDYGAVLGERSAGHIASLAEIVRHALKASEGPSLPEPVQEALAEAALDPASLTELTESLQASTAGPDVAGRSAAFMQQLGTPDAMAGRTDVVEAIAGKVDREAVAQSVAESIIEEDGASAGLAQAFRTLVPEGEAQSEILAKAERRVAATSSVGNEANFAELWKTVEHTLTSHTSNAVSPEYARELAAASAVPDDELEQSHDDPPARITAWIATIDDAALRALDLQLLLDVLEIEVDPFKWSDMLTVVVTQVENLTLVGRLEGASLLVEAIARQAEDAGGAARHPDAAQTLQRLATGGLMRHVIPQIRTGDDAAYEMAKRLCRAIGPDVIAPLAESLNSEEDERTIRRLKHVVVEFGTRGREAVQQLMNAASWQLRRTAAYLLRELDDGGNLPAMEALLTDTERLVQREAIRTIAMVGDDRAYGVLVETLAHGSSRVRKSLSEELSSLKDDRAAPLFCYLVRHLAGKRALTPLYLALMDRLATLGGSDAVTTIGKALHRGEWWSPFRTRRLRHAAAAALRGIGTEKAVGVLRDAESRGRRGVRAVVRAELAGVRR